MTPKQIEQREKEIQKLGDFIRMQGKSLSTKRAYSRQVRRFIDFVCSRDWPAGTTSEKKLEAFLTGEARRNVAAGTQMGAFHAICYYYQHVRKQPLVGVDALRAKRGERVRQAPSWEDTRKVLMAVQDSGPYPTRLICHLIYGCGLRLGETVAIRIKDLDLDRSKLTIIAGKGNKDRFINLPPSLVPQLRVQVGIAEALHQKALTMGVPTKLPNQIARKYPAATRQLRWFWLFPQSQPCNDIDGPGRVWWHCLEDTVQRAMRGANKRAGTEGITCHHLRHAWATHAHEQGACVRDLQEILGHRDIRTTMRYLRPDPERVPSPLESLDLPGQSAA
jgi:site-specific recombinase XerD